MLRALTAEVAKLKRAPLPLWSVLTVAIAPVLSNVFAAAGGTGLSAVSWPAFFNLCSMTMGAWYGILLFGLITAFLFGREYAEGLSPGLLTAPTRREYFVLAKFVVLAVWVLALSLLALIAQASAATLLGLDGFTWSSAWSSAADLLTVALLIFMTLPVVALIAVASRGVFAPMIFSAFGFTMGMMGGVAGWGTWLPWAMPAAVGGSFLGPAVGATPVELTAGSWVIAAGVFVAGVAAVMWWVDTADSRAPA